MSATCCGSSASIRSSRTQSFISASTSPSSRSASAAASAWRAPRAGQLEQIGDVGRVERLDQRARLGDSPASTDRAPRDEFGRQPVVLVMGLVAQLLGERGGDLNLRLAHR
jgi:hypothetical protein